MFDQQQGEAADVSLDDTSRGPGPVYRPPFQLRSLPIRVRWEVTRRHPYYGCWWKRSRDHHRRVPIVHPVEEPLRQAAIVILGAIGVSGEPFDPATDFEQLEAEQLNTAWLSGAVHPITMRGLAALLITGLPKETLAQLGLYFCEASCEDKEDRPPRKIAVLNELMLADSPKLDSYFDEPFVSVNPAASGRQITEAIQSLTRVWKEERGLAEKRDRSDKYVDYLRAWDLREGWTGDGYDRSQEHTLKEVAEELRTSIDTVQHHYRNAFSLIIGSEYSPELWVRTMGLLKLSEIFGSEVGRVSRRRPLRSPVRRKEVPEGVLRGRSHEDGSSCGPVTSAPCSNLGVDASQLVAKILSLIKQGVTDQAIVKELNVSDKAIEAIAYIRARPDEFSLCRSSLASGNSADDN